MSRYCGPLRLAGVLRCWLTCPATVVSYGPMTIKVGAMLAPTGRMFTPVGAMLTPVGWMAIPCRPAPMLESMHAQVCLGLQLMVTVHTDRPADVPIYHSS